MRATKEDRVLYNEMEGILNLFKETVQKLINENRVKQSNYTEDGFEFVHGEKTIIIKFKIK